MECWFTSSTFVSHSVFESAHPIANLSALLPGDYYTVYSPHIMRVVVTGASGLLGRAIYSHFVARSHDVLGLANSRAEPPLVKQDLLDEESLKSRLSDYKPDLIVHSAAERRPDVVQQQPERSQELNVDVPGRLAAISGEIGAKLIYISTDYVFDGSRPPYTVESEPNPLNAYGTSKLLGERAVKENGRDGQVTSLRVPVL